MHNKYNKIRNDRRNSSTKPSLQRAEKAPENMFEAQNLPRNFRKSSPQPQDDHQATRNSSVERYRETRYVSVAAENIDCQGGVVCLSDLNVSLKIPFGALPPGDPVQIALTVDTDEKHPTLQEDQLILGQVINCKPDGLKFLKPVTLSVPHSVINISPHCMQVWCKSDTETGKDSWKKIYDASENYADDGVRVLVEENMIKLRVDHFTGFSFITAPISKIWNWLIPPEQLLEILSYMDPAEVENSRYVCLRVYAVKTADVASRKLVEHYEGENPDSGMCCLPSGFTLVGNGKNLSVVVRNITPRQKWRADDTIEGCISYNDIQNGGQANGYPAARCEIMFLLANDEDQADSFVACLNISQEGNTKRTVKKVYVTDRKALINRDRARNTTQDPPQDQDMPQEVHEPPLLQRHNFRELEERHLQPASNGKGGSETSGRLVNRQHCQTQKMAAPPYTEALDRKALEQPVATRSQNIQQQIMVPFAGRRDQLASDQGLIPQPIPNAEVGPPSNGSVRRKQFHQVESRSQGAQAQGTFSFQSPQASRQSRPKIRNTCASRTSNDEKRYINEDDLRSKIIPCSLSWDQSSGASAPPKQLNGDCGPFLKTIAREIVHRWKQVAKVLEFSPEQCEEFESNNKIKEPWWPAYRMLLEWKDKLPKENHGEFFKMLADAIQTFDD